MNLVTNVLTMIGLAMLISGPLSAELTASQGAHHSPKLTKKFELPKALKNQKPEITLKEIYKLSKSGEFRNRPKLGGMDGGGGKILVYPEGQTLKVDVLDIYDAKKAGMHIDMGHGQTLDEKIKFVLNRLAYVAPYHALAYEKWIDDFLTKEATFYSDSILPATDDVGVTVLPRNSELLQVVVQRNQNEVKIPGMARYLVDKDVFLQLDLDSQVALIFHEIVYREARLRGEQNSLKARYLTGLILSDEMLNMTIEKFNEMMVNLDSKCLEDAAAILSCEQLPKITVNQDFNWAGVNIKGEFAITQMRFSILNQLDINLTNDTAFDMTNLVAKTNLKSNSIQKFTIQKKYKNDLVLKVIEYSQGNLGIEFDSAYIKVQTPMGKAEGVCSGDLNYSSIWCYEVTLTKNGVTQTLSDKQGRVYLEIYSDTGTMSIGRKN